MKRNVFVLLLSVLVISIMLLSSVPLNGTADRMWGEGTKTCYDDVPNGCKIADVDGDGEKEVVVISDGNNVNKQLTLYRFKDTVWEEEGLPIAWGRSFTCFDIGYIDSDDFIDIVVGTDDDTNAIYFYEFYNGSWHEDYFLKYTGSDKVNDIVISDIDADGENNVVVAYNTTSTYNLVVHTYASWGWVDTVMAKYPSAPLCVGAGDVYNYGWDTIVVGLRGGIQNELRTIHYTGSWLMDNITDLPTSVICLEVGDVYTSLHDDIVIGMEDCVNETRVYSWDSTEWFEDNVSDLSYGVRSLRIGDADNNGLNEVVIGFEDESIGEIRSYETYGMYMGWTNTSVSYGVGSDPMDLDIGDVDGDGFNEVVAVMNRTNYNFNTYFFDPNLGSTIVGLNSYDVVTGEITIECLTNSDNILRIDFLLNGTLYDVDYTYPYECTIDTFWLNDYEYYSFSFNVVQKFGGYGGFLYYFQVCSFPKEGDYLKLFTPQNTYSPDQEISVGFEHKDPPEFDYMDVTFNCTDPNGFTYTYETQTLKNESKYAYSFILPSDAIPGTYTIDAYAVGKMTGTPVWKTKNSTQITVTGPNVMDRLMGLDGNLGEIFALLNIVNFTLNERMDFIQGDLEMVRENLWEKVNETRNDLSGELQMSIEQINQDLMMVNSSLAELIMHMNPENVDELKMWLEMILPAMNDTMNGLRDEMNMKIDDIALALARFETDLMADLGNLSSELRDHDSSISAKIDNITKAEGGEPLDLGEMMNLLEDIKASVAPEEGEEPTPEANSLLAKVEKIEGDIEGHNQQMDEKLGDLQGLIENMNAMGSATEELSDLEEKIDDTDSKAAGAKQGTSINMILLIICVILLLVITALVAKMAFKKDTPPAPQAQPKAAPKKENEEETVDDEETEPEDEEE